METRRDPADTSRHAPFASARNSPSSDLTISSIATLEEAFGNQIVEAVLKELGLDRAVQMLPAAMIDQANAMCVVFRSTYAGLNFASKLFFSAKGNSHAFRALVKEVGIDPDSLSSTLRLQIDELYKAFFEAATQHNRQCVDIQKARGLMLRAICTAASAEGRPVHAAFLKVR